ncbi:two-component sensor histidine kinase [Phormidium sp. LEGE 05292]|uniref:two-component system sensor histidine kinase RppB n=1 Tax=[Phormidium] sp. LEGE 05292 TaxID=767427 RepID=UPI0018804819|nr:two-component system sensor histidine kinase RppB [Phormidium sp. LEGE 05292]MBE9227391.1 two-component sensor histidine kinase [Phormidium sp. LEGE 05292]
MNQNKLFNRTRTRLALSYAGVMGIILSLSGFGVYEAIAHAHRVAIDRELESVAGTLHDSIELKLNQPGRLEPIVEELLPNLCLAGSSCMTDQVSSSRHILSAINQGDYYIRFFDSSGQLIAIAGVHPEGLPLILNKQNWQIIKDSKGNFYHQISISLHTHDNRDWGYFQVGRSLKDLNDYLNNVKWIMKLGLPTTLILVAVSSWWLAGLAMQPIYQSYKQIQQFTADAAHELRTPLAATQATIESVHSISNLDEQELQDILETIGRQNRRLIQLVADLLLLARLEQQVAPRQFQLCCLDDIVNDLVEEFAALALSKSVNLTADIQVNNSLNVMGNEEQLYRLVSNLIINAIQYTPADGQVTVILDSIDNQALIQIQDTGIGIPPAEQTLIFDRFYRINSDRSRHTGGSGLGLAIAKAIIQSHKGSIQLQSELGKGSTFTIRLPLEY